MYSVNQPRISIITVVYNAAEVLETTILSVTNQFYQNIEYIIIDGQSTDATPEIVRRYRNKISQYIREPDNGVYDAMNKGCKIATGDWIYFLGAGDVLLNILHKMPMFLNNSDIVYGDVYKLDELKMYDGKFHPFKFAVKNISHQAIFYPAWVFKQYQYNLKYKVQADYDLNMRCYGRNDTTFRYIPVIISIYEGDGLSAVIRDIPFFTDKLQIIKNNFSFVVYCYALLRNKVAKIVNNNHWTNK